MAGCLRDTADLGKDGCGDFTEYIRTELILGLVLLIEGKEVHAL